METDSSEITKTLVFLLQRMNLLQEKMAELEENHRELIGLVDRIAAVKLGEPNAGEER